MSIGTAMYSFCVTDTVSPSTRTEAGLKHSDASNRNSAAAGASAVASDAASAPPPCARSVERVRTWAAARTSRYSSAKASSRGAVASRRVAHSSCGAASSSAAASAAAIGAAAGSAQKSIARRSGARGRHGAGGQLDEEAHEIGESAERGAGAAATGGAPRTSRVGG